MLVSKDVFRYLFKNIIDINYGSVRILINMYNSCSWMKNCMTKDQLWFVEEWKDKARPFIVKYFMDLESKYGECTKCGKSLKITKLSKHQRKCRAVGGKNYLIIKNIELDYCKICKWRHPVTTRHYEYIANSDYVLKCGSMRKTCCNYCKCNIFFLIKDKHERDCKKRCECVLRKRLSPYMIQYNKLKGINESYHYERCKLKTENGTSFCRIHNTVKVIYS
jgi:hypothetical protein